MSIINDALKKAQRNLKKPDKQPEKQGKKNSPDIQEKKNSQNNQPPVNVYEKLYKNRENQQNASLANNTKEETASKKTQTLRRAKKWFKTCIVVLFCFACIGLSALILDTYYQKPFQNFIRSAKRSIQPSRKTSMARPVNKKRRYRPGEMVLNGTSLIDGKKVALINGQIYVNGDIVDGKKITSIGLNKVELRNDQKIVTLRVR